MVGTLEEKHLRTARAATIAVVGDERGPAMMAAMEARAAVITVASGGGRPR